MNEWSTIFAFFLATAATISFVSQSVSAANETSTELHPATLLGQRAALLIKNRLLYRQGRLQHRAREICYDMVGCFPMPRAQISPLKKPPQAPEAVDTKFILLTQPTLYNGSSLAWLTYGDDQKSLIQANFDYTLPTKIIVHGFKGSGHDKTALDIATAFLEIENANIILVDWQKGAAGPSYVAAAANTQLVGRQLALLLMDTIILGSNPLNTHIIGFSLGAHIAGYAGRTILKKGLKVGRITGLDPASPLFRELLSTSLSPLNKNDAEFVDIIHTDGARFITEGLGIFRPIGHVDYFPNGGFDQPGCNHVRGAVIASHLGGSLNTSIVCNHLRALQLFLESLKSSKSNCEFWSYPCPGGWSSFEKGNCFPTRCTDKTCGKMGYFSNKSKYLGPLFLATRDSSPYCGKYIVTSTQLGEALTRQGHQLHVSTRLSKNIGHLRGDMQLSILTDSETVHFKLYSDFREELQGGYVLNGIGAVALDLISPEKTPTIAVHISCHILNQRRTAKRNVTPALAIDEASIRDVRGNVWRYFKVETPLSTVNGTSIEAVTVLLTLEP